jgi:hypothetical protein
MKVKTSKCLITLGPMTVVSKEVWIWEGEVLKEKFGGQCSIEGQGESEISELPSAESEVSRMQDAYGVDEDTKVSHVENTFGRGKVGLKELEKSINSSKPKAKPGPKPKAAKPVKPAPKVESKTEKDPFE